MAAGAHAGHRWRLVLVASLLSLLPGACAADRDEPGLTVFAAASLRAVSDELEAAWTAAHPDSPLTLATDGSNVLAAQIAEGAGADVFLSADEEYPRRLADEGHAQGVPVVYARNEVTLVVRVDAPLAQPSDLARPGVRLVLAGPSTPIGRYTAASIAALATTMPDPDAFAAAVEANVASHEDNVRAALAKVELGEGDAAFVYRTDALGSEEVREVALPAPAHIAAVYAAVRTSERPAAAEFLEWLIGPDAGSILAAAGFVVKP